MKSRKQHSIAKQPILEAGESFKQGKFFTTLQKFKVKEDYRFKSIYLQSTKLSKANIIIANLITKANIKRALETKTYGISQGFASGTATTIP